MGTGKTLSEREIGAIEVLKTDGKSTREIARAINRSKTVVLNYLKNPLNYGLRYKGFIFHLFFI